jgi:hypothetical protein
MKNQIEHMPGGTVSAPPHMVCSAPGGYEWINKGAAVDFRIVAVELDEQQKITRFTATWDGSRQDDVAMTTLLGETVER